MRLAYQLWPAPTASTQPPLGQNIVFLHGMGGTGALWRPIAASLENRYRIYAFDQRGHGGSRIARTSGGRDAHQEDGFTPLHYGRDVVETIESLQIAPTWLVGHSMGVRTACAAAHLKPELFKGLVLVDLGFSGEAGGGLGSGLAQFLRVLPTTFESREQAREFMTAHCPDPSIAQYLMAVSQRGPDGTISFPFDHGALIETVHAVGTISVRQWVEALVQKGMPLLVLRGERSLVWTREQFEAERKHFAGASGITFLEFEGAGHGLPFEQRPRFVEELERFFAERRSRGSSPVS